MEIPLATRGRYVKGQHPVTGKPQAGPGEQEVTKTVSGMCPPAKQVTSLHTPRPSVSGTSVSFHQPLGRSGILHRQLYREKEGNLIGKKFSLGLGSSWVWYEKHHYLKVCYLGALGSSLISPYQHLVCSPKGKDRDAFSRGGSWYSSPDSDSQSPPPLKSKI